jgi:hypothetical protein
MEGDSGNGVAFFLATSLCKFLLFFRRDHTTRVDDHALRANTI